MRRLFLAVLTVLGAVSCAPAHKSVVHPDAYLAPPAEPPMPAPPPGPLRIVLSLPSERAPFDPDIALVFDRNLRALEPLQSAPIDAPLLVSLAGRPVAGAWQLAGLRTLQFIPVDSFHGATTYSVAAGERIRALDGSSLASAFGFSFTTPLPALLSSVPSDGARDVAPDTTLSLTFNQRMNVDELARTATLRAGSSPKALPFDAAWAEPSGRTLLLTPKSPLPIAETIRLSIAPALTAADGPLPAGKQQQLTFETIRPVEAHFVCEAKMDAGACPVDGSLSVELTRSVKLSALQAHVRVEGGCAWERRPWLAPDDDVSEVPISVADAGKPCTVTLRRGLRDDRGLVVTQEKTISLTFLPRPPRFLWGLEGSILEPLWSQGHDVTFAPQSIPSFEVASAPLSESEWIATYLDAGPSSDTWSRSRLKMVRSTAQVDFDRLSARPGARAWRMASTEASATRWVGRKPAAEVLGHGSERRMVVIRYRADDGLRTEWRLPQVTDLALHATLSPFGSLVWVTRMSDGTAVRDAEIVVRRAAGRGQVVGRTGADGTLVVPESAYRPATPAGRAQTDAVLIARKGDDAVIESLLEAPVEPDRAWIDNLEPTGAAFTERGLYRRGETAHVAGFLRYRSATGAAAPPAGTALEVQASDFDGNRFYELRTVTDAWGRFAVDVPISGSVRFGRASALVYLAGPDARPGPQNSYVARAAFQVGAPRTPVHEADAQVASPAYVHGDTATWTVSGRYLFGSAMRGCETQYMVAAAPTSASLPLETGYTVEDPYPPNALGESGYASVQIATGHVTLDDAGRVTVRVPLIGFTQTRPAMVTLYADVQDASRQTVSASASTLVHAAPLYVALLRPPYGPLEPGASVDAEAKVVDTQGEAKAGYSLRFDLHRRTTTHHDRTAKREAFEEIRDVPVGGCNATSSAEHAAGCTLRTTTPGQYVLRAQTRLDHGAVVAASAALTVERPRPEPPAPRTEPEPDTFSWNLDGDKHYNEGETVNLRVHAPQPVEALVTVSNGGILFWRRARFDGDSTLSIPVSEAMAPQSTVRLEAVTGRTAPPEASGRDPGAPVANANERSFEVNDTRHLRVEVTTPRTDYKPDEQVQVRVRVTGQDGTPAQAALVVYAVDEGELELTSYRTPDPFDDFRSWNGPGVWTRNTMDELGRLRDLSRSSHYSRPPTVRMGATSVADPPVYGVLPRERFNPVPWYDATVVTGQDGVASASFKLPQQLTAFRIMAVAATRTERAGSGETRVVVHQPLMVRPALPRFARQGDAFEAGVVVSAQQALRGPVEVSVETQGVVADSGSTRTITVPSGGEAEVRFPLRATTSGEASLTFRAHSGDVKDAVVAKLPIERAAAVEAVSASGEANGLAVEPIGKLQGVRGDVGGLDVVISANPFDQAGESVRELVEYPYGCAEQRSSSLVGSVVARRWAAISHFMPVRLLRDAQSESLAGLVDLQRKDGSFGFWTSSPGRDGWLTAYVLLVAGEMDRQGFPAAQGVVRKATWYLERWLPDARLDTPHGLASAALALDALSLHGPLKPELVAKLIAQLERMPPGPAALVAHALRDDPVLRSRTWDALHKTVESHLRIVGPDAAYVQEGERADTGELASDVRTTAMVLRTFARRPTRDPLTLLLARGLLALRTGATWGSTQRDAWAVLALESARKVTDAPSFPRQARIMLAGSEFGRFTLTSESPSASLRVPMLALQALQPSYVRIETSQGPALPYDVLLRYAPEQLPAQALDRGFAVSKRFYEVVDGKPRLPAIEPGRDGTVKLPLGEFVLMDVVVQARGSHGQVVIDDPLPAGVEAVDPGLATSTQYVDEGYPAIRAETRELLDSAAAGGDSPGVVGVRTHKEIHPDRVLVFLDDMPAGYYRFQTLVRTTTQGRYVQPPTRVEAMYSPSVSGRTAAARVVVEERGAGR